MIDDVSVFLFCYPRLTSSIVEAEGRANQRKKYSPVSRMHLSSQSAIALGEPTNTQSQFSKTVVWHKNALALWFDIVFCCSFGLRTFIPKAAQLSAVRPRPLRVLTASEPVSDRIDDQVITQMAPNCGPRWTTRNSVQSSAGPRRTFFFKRPGLIVQDCISRAKCSFSSHRVRLRGCHEKGGHGQLLTDDAFALCFLYSQGHAYAHPRSRPPFVKSHSFIGDDHIRQGDEPLTLYISITITGIHQSVTAIHSHHSSRPSNLPAHFFLFSSRQNEGLHIQSSCQPGCPAIHSHQRSLH